MSGAGEAAITVEADPATWLPGPVLETPEEWLSAAFEACLVDFDLPAESEDASYLHDVLEVFATADLACDLRFLRLRGVEDVPVVARLLLVTGESADWSPFDEPVSDAQPYDDAVREETLDEALGLRRRLDVVVDHGVLGHVRYHRYAARAGVHVVLASGGLDVRQTFLALPDLDALARGVRVVLQDGVPA